MKRIALLSILFQFLTACSSDDRLGYDEGYDDGYAAGYNTTCVRRVTLVEGAWDNADYSDGYADGEYDGEVDCHREKKN